MGMAPRLSTQPGLRLLSYLALLPTNALELDAAVSRAVVENPLLGRRPWRSCRTCGLATVADRCPACSTPAWEAEHAAVEDWRADLLRDARAELRTSLHGLAAEVVGALDDRGLLPEPPTAEPGALAAVVEVLRLVGPPGLAARSPTDCVAVQARALVAEGQAPALLAEIVEDWLPAVAEGRYDEIAVGLGTSEEAVTSAVETLRTRIRPFVVLNGTSTRSAPTDVVFARPRTPDAPVVAHVADLSSLGLERVTDVLPPVPEARAWAAPHREAADRLIAAITARSRMLQRVADELAVRQRGFILDGPSDHVPLRRREVAAALSVHPSTVGRAVDGKLARCPDGRVVELAAFFGVGTSIRCRVEAAVQANPGATDADLAVVLARSGRPIARRTVAKYRALGANGASSRL